MSRVLKREWTTAEGWRDTKAGMWAWLIQRAAAVALLLVIALHLVNPFRREVQAALLALALRSSCTLDDTSREACASVAGVFAGMPPERRWRMYLSWRARLGLQLQIML